LLEGKKVNLRIVEREDLPLFTEWGNNLDFFGEFIWSPQQSRMDVEMWYENLPHDSRIFFIEKKDGTKIRTIGHYLAGNLTEMGYILVSNERSKGYCSEAVMIMVDYLFLSKDIMRVQAHTDLRNLASQKVLEKSGFKNEGTIRKSYFVRGEWRDNYLYSILREEWKEPKILTKTA